MPSVKFEKAVAKADEQNVEVVAEQAVPQVEMVGEKSFNEIIKDMMANGCQRFNDVIVKNVLSEEFDNYTRVTLVAKDGLPAFVSDDNGASYHEGKSNNIFTSTFAIAGSLKEDEELSWMANTVIDHPNVLNLILNGSKVDVLVQRVASGEEYINPFTTKSNPTPTTFDNDTIIKYVIKVKLGKTGAKMADKLADKLMGF